MRVATLLRTAGPGGYTSLMAADAQGTDAGAMRVAIADDSVLFREGIAKLLQHAGFRIVGQSSTADDLLLKVRSYSPEVAIVDIRMPPTHTDEGMRAAREIRESHPGTGVLVLSQYVEAQYMIELIQGDVEGIGYLLKDRIRDVGEFADAVRRVGEGGSAFDPMVVSRLIGRRSGEDPIGSLTPRERDVLALMAEGRSNQGIAEKLVVTEGAVEKHVGRIFGKLDLHVTDEGHRRVLAVLTYLNSS
jgi:DNA-binding NarL/FixJ family response regulator